MTSFFLGMAIGSALIGGPYLAVAAVSAVRRRLTRRRNLKKLARVIDKGFR